MAQGAWGGWTVARRERFWSGAEVFTESFHDFSPPDLKVDYYRTFVYANVTSGWTVGSSVTRRRL